MMNQYTRIALFGFLFLGQACATHLPGIRAKEVGDELTKKDSPALQISVDTLDGATSKYYRAFVVSFMNNSDHWIQISSLNAKFPKLSQQPTFLLGDKLNSYLESVDRRNKIDSHNRNLILSGLALVGALGVQTAKSPDLKMAGIGLVASSVSVEAVQSVLNSKQKSEFHEALPVNHLLKPFVIPPGLSMSRWVVVSLKESEYFQEMAIDLTEEDGKTKSYTIDDWAYRNFLKKEAEKTRYR